MHHYTPAPFAVIFTNKLAIAYWAWVNNLLAIWADNLPYASDSNAVKGNLCPNWEKSSPWRILTAADIKLWQTFVIRSQKRPPKSRLKYQRTTRKAFSMN